MSDLLLRRAKSQNSYDKDQMEKLLETILEIESFITSVERKGVPFREFVALRQANRYPRYQAALGDKIQFLYSEEELLFIEERERRTAEADPRRDARFDSS